VSGQDWQLLPVLSEAEYAALKADIAEHGMTVPVVIDAESGAVIDGHHRVRAWEELRASRVKVPDYPRDVRRFGSDEERVSMVLALNLARRHLNKSQRGELVARLRKEGWSIRRIAELLRVGRSTIGDDVTGVRKRTPENDESAMVVGRDAKSYPARRPTPAPSLFVRGKREEGRARAALSALPEGASSPSNLRRAEERGRMSALAARREKGVPKRHSGGDWEVRNGDFREVLSDRTYEVRRRMRGTESDVDLEGRARSAEAVVLLRDAVSWDYATGSGSSKS